MKDNLLQIKQYGQNIAQIMRDKRHEQKSKALGFALMYSLLPILLLINLTISLLPPSFFTMVEDAIEVLPIQYQSAVSQFIQENAYADFGIIPYLVLIVFILYTIAKNVRLLIEISNDCYDKSPERSKLAELVISAVLFIVISFAVLFIFAIVIAGQTMRTFLQYINAGNIAQIIDTILHMKSILTIIVFFVVFYLIYYFAPNVKSSFHSTIVGTLISSIGLYFASQIFEIYLANNTSYELLYKSYAPYILFLFGMYITCQIIVGSLIINSLIYEKVSIKFYHITHPSDGQ